MEKANGEGIVRYSGKTLAVREDPVQVQGRATTREVVERVPAVAVIAEDSHQRILMIRQYRWPVQSWLWELPAGKIEANETERMAAERELREESGYLAAQWQLIHRFYPSPGYTNEEIFLFYARDLRHRRPDPDPDEEIHLALWDRETVQNALRDGDIHNGIAVAGLYWWLFWRMG